MDAPPVLTAEHGSYARWKLEIKHWQVCTRIEKNNQASALLLSLRDKKAKEACLEIPIESLNAEDGVDVLLSKLDGFYAQDELRTGFSAYEEFEWFKRPHGMKIIHFKSVFDEKYNKAKRCGMSVSDAVLAYKFMVATRLTGPQLGFVKGGLCEMTYKAMVQRISLVNLEQGQEDNGISSNYQRYPANQQNRQPPNQRAHFQKSHKNPDGRRKDKTENQKFGKNKPNEQKEHSKKQHGKTNTINNKNKDEKESTQRVKVIV